jgi:hypothetical protein
LTYGRTGANDPGRELEAAQLAIDDFHAANNVIRHPSWLASAARCRFEWALRRATLRAFNGRERPWLDAAAWDAYAEAEHRIRVSDSTIWQAQWASLVMKVGLLRRDDEQVLEGARGYMSITRQNQWIPRDHPGEQRLYETYRQRALRQMPRLAAEL